MHGGIGTFTQIMARGLVRAGNEVRVVGVYSADEPAAAYEEDQGVRVWRLKEPQMRFGWIVARIRQYRLVASWVREGHCDLLESPDYSGWIAGWPRLPIPVILRAHGSLTNSARILRRPIHPIGHLLEVLGYRRADAWVAVSRYAGDLTAKLFGLRFGPSAILYNPVDVLPPITPFSSRNRTMVVFTGTVTRGKGIVTLFNAWPMVKQRFPKAELHLYGKDGSAPGERMNDFLIDCVPKDLHDSVKFHGHVPRSELIRSLKAARVAVFPSFVEAFAMAPLESMACGCPTIYSKRGSGPEVIKDGIDGLLVDPGDASELAESIIAVMNNDDLAKRLSEQGRERVKRNFSLADLLIKNEALFDAVSRSFRKPLLGTDAPAKNGGG